MVMYGFKSWTIKKAKQPRTDVFKLWCWRRLLRVPWTARRSDQSILKEISPEYSLEYWCWSWNSNILATWWEELTHLKRPPWRERLRAGGEGDDRGWDGWMASPTQWTWVWVNSGRWWWTGRPGVLRFMGSQRVGHDWETELNWTEQLKTILSHMLLKVGNPGVIQLSVLAQGFMRLPSSEALTWAGGFPSKMAYSHSCWNQLPCWLLGESLSSFTWASLLGYLNVLKIRLSWLLEWVIQEDEQGGCSDFYDLVSDASFSLLQYSNIRSEPLSPAHMWRGV